MSLNRVNRPPTTSQTAGVTPPAPRHTRSEEGGVARKECQQKVTKRRKNVSKSIRKLADLSHPQRQRTVEKVPMKSASMSSKWGGQFPADEAEEDNANSDGDLSIDDEKLEQLAEQVYKFHERVNQLHEMKDCMKGSMYRNIYVVVGMFIVYMLIGGYQILLPTSMKELIGTLLNKGYGTEYYFAPMIFNEFRIMILGTAIYSFLNILPST